MRVGHTLTRTKMDDPTSTGKFDANEANSETMRAIRPRTVCARLKALPLPLSAWFRTLLPKWEKVADARRLLTSMVNVALPSSTISSSGMVLKRWGPSSLL